MKDIRIDFTKSEPWLDSKQLGEYGEKGVERFAITPPEDMSNNPEITNYVVAFSTVRGPLRLNPVPKTDVIYVAVEEASAGGVPVSLQLEGHNDTDTLIMKTQVIDGISFARSVPDGNIRNPGAGSFMGHFHSNYDVLKNIADENGNLVYNGKVIGARKLKTVELTADEHGVYSYTDLSYTGSIYFVVSSGIPCGAEIVSLDLKFDFEGVPDCWFNINELRIPGEGLFPAINEIYKSFYLEEYDAICVASRYYINEMTDGFYTAANYGGLTAMRVTYVDESGEE